MFGLPVGLRRRLLRPYLLLAACSAIESVIVEALAPGWGLWLTVPRKPEAGLRRLVLP